MMRDMRVAPWLLVVCSLVVSCDVVPPCGPENCTGCCSSDGTCLSGSTSSACGSQGNVCGQCPAFAQCVSTSTCTFGTSCSLRLCQFPAGGGGGGGSGGGFFGGGAGGGAGGSPFGGGFTDGGGAGGGGGGSCLPESDGVLCARLHLDCGAVNIMDTCGLARSLSCGMCSSPRVCGGDGLANVCSTPCVPESDATFCARLGASCGSATQFDNCGATRTVASCGACMNDCQSQSTCVNNACIGTPKADGERCGAPTGRDFCRTGQCTTAQAYCEPSGTQFIYSSATKTTSGAGPCVCSTTTALHFEYGAGSSLPAEDTTCTACSTSAQRAVCF